MSKFKKKAKRGGLGGLLDAHAETPTKNKVGESAKKTLVDTLAGATFGAGIGSLVGNFSIPAGIIIIGISHYTEEKSGILRLAGSSAIAYGIAKFIENQNASKSAGVNGLEGQGELIKARLTKFKDEVLAAYYLDRLFKKKETETPKEVKSEIQEPTIGEIDLSALDIFEEYNHFQASEYERENDALEEPRESYSGSGYTQRADQELQAPFGMYDENDEPDFSKF
ncbi:MAG: hypothetical protein HYZ43_02500 [Flavobacteriia bacterium]|nr:hypothetical protein [Flavobacteriia bacterium]